MKTRSQMQQLNKWKVIVRPRIVKVDQNTKHTEVIHDDSDSFYHEGTHFYI